MDPGKFQIQDPHLIAEVVLKKYGINRVDETIAYSRSPQHWVDKLEEDLYQDLYDLTNEDNLIKKCALAYIPDINGNAIAVKVGNDEYAIAINLGIVWLCFLFCQALLMEAEDNRNNDDPKKVFFSALRAFSATSSEQFLSEIGYCSNLGEVDLLVSAGGIGSVVLRFIALHEFAHVKLGHADSFGRSFAISADDVTTNYQCPSEFNLSERQVDELRADCFAVSKIIYNATSKETARNSILFIYAFFLSLQVIEDQNGKNICPEHPSPLIRGREVLRYCDAQIGIHENDTFIWLDLIFNTWKGNYVSDLMFSIRTNNPDEILAIFNNESTLIADGLKVTHNGTTLERGMTLEEAVMNFGLSLVSGVPAGIVANYLYQKFVRDGENVLRLDGKLVKDIDELKTILQQLLEPKDS